MSTVKKCVMCATSSVLCLKCENKQLCQYIVELQNKLSVYEEAEATDYNLELIEKFKIHHYIRQSSKLPDLKQYLPVEKPSLLNDNQYQNYLQTYRFITMTFDPAKWGTQQKEQIRKDNILYSLAQLVENKTIISLFGCFEYHKNGIVHAHAVIRIKNDDYIKLIKAVLTDNTRNKTAFQQGPAKFPQSVEYITKESNEYFYSLSANTINTPRLTASA